MLQHQQLQRPLQILQRFLGYSRHLRQPPGRQRSREWLWQLQLRQFRRMRHELPSGAMHGKPMQVRLRLHQQRLRGKERQRHGLRVRLPVQFRQLRRRGLLQYVLHRPLPPVRIKRQSWDLQ
jgi:hypothetical protein